MNSSESLETLPLELLQLIANYLGDFLLVARFCRPFLQCKFSHCISENLYLIATGNDSFILLSWLLSKKCPKYERIRQSGYIIPPINAAGFGNLANLLMLKKADFPFTQSVMTTAAKNGHIQIMEQLIKWKITPTDDTSAYAMGWGQLDVCKWLTSNRWFVITQGGKKMAARNGHLKILIWLYDSFPFEFPGSSELHAAAQGGQLEVVQFLWANMSTNSCMLVKSNILEVALMAGQVHVANWLELMNVKLKRETSPQISIIAASGDSTMTLDWLYSRGFVLGDKCLCVSRGETKKWLMENVFI